MANINVTYDDLRNATTRLNQGKEEILTKLTELNQYIDNLVASGYVTDQSSKVFDETFDEYIKGTRTAVEALDKLGLFLTRAAEALQQTDEALANQLR